MLKIAFLRVWPVSQIFTDTSLTNTHTVEFPHLYLPLKHRQWSFHMWTYPSQIQWRFHIFYRLHTDSGVSTCVLTHHTQTAEFPQSRASIGDTWPSHSPHPASTWQLPRYSVPRSSARSHVRYQEGGLVLQCSGPPSPRHSSKCDWHWYSCVFLSVLLGWSHLQNVFWII